MTRQKAPWSFAAVDIEVPSSGTREVLLTRASGDWTGWTVDGVTAPASVTDELTVTAPSSLLGRRWRLLDPDGRERIVGCVVAAKAGSTSEDLTVDVSTGATIVEVTIAGGGGGGAVDSVNGETGVVVLDATDVGADPAGSAAAVAGDLATHEGLTTTAHGGIVASTDPRLTDARTPTAHAASHQDGGSDELALDGSQITTGTVGTARLGSGTPSAGTVLASTGTSTSWDVTSGAGSPWTPISGASYLIPEGITNPSPAVAMDTQRCVWSWRHTRGPWAITSLGIYIASVGATPGQYRLHLHLMGPSGKPGDLLWVAPSVYTASTNATLAIVNLASPVTVPAGHTFGVGVQQIVASSTTTIQHAPMKQEPEGAVAVVYTSNLYGWVASGTSPLGSAPTVSTQQLNQVPKILVGIA